MFGIATRPKAWVSCKMHSMSTRDNCIPKVKLFSQGCIPSVMHQSLSTACCGQFYLRLTWSVVSCWKHPRCKLCLHLHLHLPVFAGWNSSQPFTWPKAQAVHHKCCCHLDGPTAAPQVKHGSCIRSSTTCNTNKVATQQLPMR